jgi:hypothetical protein
MNRLNDLAELCQTQGKYTKAKRFYKRSFTISDKKLGADHPNIAPKHTFNYRIYKTA